MRRMIASAVLASAVASVVFFPPRLVFCQAAPDAAPAVESFDPAAVKAADVSKLTPEEQIEWRKWKALQDAAHARNRPIVANQPPAPAVAAAPATKPANVPVKVVVLFSSGVGYFEHAGNVSGSGQTELRFKSKQINDVLKSLILEDSGGGKVTAVSYPSQDPVDRTLKSFQVDITGDPSLGDLLGQLRGAKVNVTVGAETTEGTILGLEKHAESVGKDADKTVEHWVLNLIADGTIRQFELEKVTKLELEDKTLREELSRALTALSASRDQDKKPVTISFSGDGERLLRVGYVVETPIWKTSYRLILDDAAKEEKARASIQGWAIVENQTDNDWEGVELSLVSGRPISFIQDLYQPLYIPRPTVRPELYASLTPQTYEGGLDAAKPKDELALNEAATPAPASPPAGFAAGAVVGQSVVRQKRESFDSQYAKAAKPMDATASVASVASATKLGELFQYTVGSVTLPRQRSAMIPIITDPVHVEPLSIYNQSVLAGHPLTGARVKNTTGKHLLAGPVTVLQAGRYAGDASLDNVPPGQQRLLSFGVDLDVTVDATKNNTESNIVSGSIVKGVLSIQRRLVVTQNYEAENKGEKDKVILIEHPLRQGWKLVDTGKPVETTEALYRFEGKLPAGKASKLAVKEEQTQSETFAILPGDLGQIQYYTNTGEIPQKVRDALAKAAELKSALITTQRALDERNTQVQQISGEQQRIRDNMKSVAQNSDYYNRLVKKLNDQESKIEGLQKEQQDLHEKIDAQRKALEDYVATLTVE